MKRMRALLVLALFAVAFVLSGCGKSSSEGGSENKGPMDAIKVKQILDEDIPLLKSDNKDDRLKAAQALGELGEQGKKAIPDLVARMGDANESPEVAQAAKDALAKITAPSIAEALAANFSAMSGYKKQIDGIRADLIAAQGAAGKNDEELKAITAERDALLTVKADFDKKLADKDAVLKMVTDALQAANTAQAKAEADLKSANDTVAAQKQEIDKLNNQMKDLEAKANAAGDQSQKAAAEIQNLTQQLADAKAKLDAAMQAVSARDAQIEQLKKQVADLQAQIAKLQATPAPTPPPVPIPEPPPAPAPVPAPSTP